MKILVCLSVPRFSHPAKSEKNSIDKTFPDCKMWWQCSWLPTLLSKMKTFGIFEARHRYIRDICSLLWIKKYTPAWFFWLQLNKYASKRCFDPKIPKTLEHNTSRSGVILSRPTVTKGSSWWCVSSGICLSWIDCSKPPLHLSWEEWDGEGRAGQVGGGENRGIYVILEFLFDSRAVFKCTAIPWYIQVLYHLGCMLERGYGPAL